MISIFFVCGCCSRLLLKYLVDDNEWVSVSCDAVLSECLNTSSVVTAAKANTLRLSVHDGSRDG